MRRQVILWGSAALLLVLLPHLVTSGFAVTLLNGMLIAVIFAVAYNMLLGQGGMLSFGHAVFFGIAGYSSAHLLNAMGEETLPYMPVSLMPLVAGLIALVFGVLIGYVSTRRAGTTFAMISLGFAEMATALTLVLVSFFNGEEGVQTDRYIGPEPFGITFGPDEQVYYLIAAWCLVAVIAMYALTRTPFGRMSNAVRENPERAEFIGYDTQRVRWLAFSLSSFFAGIAGGLHAIHFEHVGFETVGIIKSGAVLFMAYIGGIGHFLGPILGAVIFTFLEGTLSEVTEAWFLYLGLIFCAIVMFAPGGLAGLIMMHEPIWRTDVRLLGRLAGPYALGIGCTLFGAAGVIGLLELTYFRSTNLTGEMAFSLYGIGVDAGSPVPWIASAVVAGAGALLCRLTYPRVAQVWGEVSEIARRDLLGLEPQQADAPSRGGARDADAAAVAAGR